MIEWRIDKPQGDVIVAKISETFCDKKECYEVLHFASKPYPHYYDAWCEEVPYSAIEKWALIKQKIINNNINNILTKMALTIFIITVCYLLGVVIALAVLAGINNGCIDDIPVGIAAFSWLVVVAVIVTGVFYIVVPNVNKLFMPLYNWFYKEFHK